MITYKVPCIYNKIHEAARSRTHAATVPGSKSITNRALLISSLAEGRSVLKNVLFSDDSRVFVECLHSLGIRADVDETAKTIIVNGTGGKLPGSGEIYVGSAGTAARFLTAALGLSNGDYLLNSSEQMKRRPIAPLLETLKAQGTEVSFEEKEGHFPFGLHSHGFNGSPMSVNIDDSSQFLSALLIASVMSDHDVRIDVTGHHGMSYIDMTVKMMEQFNVKVECLEKHDPEDGFYDKQSGHDKDLITGSNSPIKVKDAESDGKTFQIPASSSYSSKDYYIEPDMSAAAYFFAASPILGIKTLVRGTSFGSMQGDVQFVHALEKMGCTAEETPDGIVMNPPADGSIHGIDVDMSAFSDQAITLACVAPFADAPTTIRGIGHIRLQESDRLSAIANEMRKMGITVDETSDSITIHPGSPSSAIIETYDDHRIAMGFSLIGLRSPGIEISNPGCVSKTFENYFEVLEGLIEDLELR